MIRHSGIGVYLRELIRHLLRADAGLALDLFGDPALLGDFEGDRVSVWPFRAPIYGLRERMGWPREAERCDVLHAPHHCAPGRAPRPMVVTIHDLIHLLGPGELHGARRWWVRRLFRQSVTGSASVICDSAATRDDLMASVGEAQGRAIHVIPLAPGAEFLAVEDRARDMALRREAGFPERYWLAVGIDKPHKGYGFLLDLMRNRAEADMLVVVGPDSAAFQRNHCAALSGLPANVDLHAGVSDSLLMAALRGARALLMPSRREGFGLPAVEAMAAGCPVLAARAGSLPEVVGEGGVLLPMDDPKAWTAAMDRIGSDAAWRAELIAQGRAWVRRFSWEETARRTLEVYEEAAGGRRAKNALATPPEGELSHP